MKNVKVIVAAHKKYRMPEDNSLYIPVQVGAAGKDSIGYFRDDTGDNISEKNPYFCELTGLYWAWKNLDADYIGLVHYRRYFASKKSKFRNHHDKFAHILTADEASSLFDSTNIILPSKRNYLIENLYDHYRHTLHVKPLDITGEIIKEKYPEYYPEFENLKARRSAHMFNMMIMRKDVLNNYCTWLFDILFELEERMASEPAYDGFHARFYGRVSELLLDVYINTRHLAYREVPVMEMDHVNWFVKGKSFLAAKFLGKKYEKSF